MNRIFSSRTLSMTSLLLLAASLWLTLPPDSAWSEGPVFSEVAVERTLPPGAPAAADVCIRGLMPRFRGENQPHDTLEAIRGFHATRLEWIYGLDKEFIARARALGCSVQAAAANGCWAPEKIDNPNAAAQFVNGKGLALPGAPRFEELSILDVNLEPVVAPWMRTWKPQALWGCINNPEMRAGHLRYMQNLVDLGVDGIQQDAPGMNRSACHWGACYCDHCVRGFREYLATATTPDMRREMGIENLGAFNYREMLKAQGAPGRDEFTKWSGGSHRLKTLFRDFQAESTAEFHRWWRGELNRYAGRPVSVSANNRGWKEPYSTVFDFSIRELNAGDARPESLYEMMREAAEFGKSQVVTMPLVGDPTETTEWKRLTRQTLATAYATGGHMEAPWDTYLPAPGAPRYFGRYADYADLYAFARGCEQYLEGYEDAAAVGRGLEDERWRGLKPVTVLDRKARVCAFVRALPGGDDKPVAIHLVDWSDSPEPFVLSLDPAAIFGGRTLRLRLALPRNYDKQAHEEAWQSKNYASMVEWRDLPGGAVASARIPALRPWGLLVVEPAASAETVWAPAVLTDGSPFLEQTRVALSCATDGAEIFYTLDGSEPNREAAPYTAPVSIADSVTLKARAWQGDKASETTVAPFHKGPPVENIIVNGDFEKGKDGWQVLLTGAKPGALKFDIDTSGKLGSPHCARLTVVHPTGRDYHLRLKQEFSAKPGERYLLSFAAEADRPVKVRIGLQEVVPPHRVLGIGFFDIGPTRRVYSLSALNAQEELVSGIHFDFGAVEEGRVVWLDDVELTRE